MQMKYSVDWCDRVPDPLMNLAAVGSVGINLVDDRGTFFKSSRKLTIGFQGASGYRSFLENPIPEGEGLVFVAKDATTMIRGLKTLDNGWVSALRVSNGNQLGAFCGRWNDGGSTGWVGGTLSLIGGNVATGVKIIGGSIGLKLYSLMIDALSDKDTVASPRMMVDKQERRARWRRAFNDWDSVVATCGREGRLRHKCAIMFICAGHEMPGKLKNSPYGNVDVQIGDSASPSRLANLASKLFYQQKVKQVVISEYSGRSGGIFG